MHTGSDCGTSAYQLLLAPARTQLQACICAKSGPGRGGLRSCACLPYSSAQTGITFLPGGLQQPLNTANILACTIALASKSRDIHCMHACLRVPEPSSYAHRSDALAAPARIGRCPLSKSFDWLRLQVLAPATPPWTFEQTFCMHMPGLCQSKSALKYQALTGSLPLSCDKHFTRQNSCREHMQLRCLKNTNSTGCPVKHSPDYRTSSWAGQRPDGDGGRGRWGTAVIFQKRGWQAAPRQGAHLRLQLIPQYALPWLPAASSLPANDTALLS